MNKLSFNILINGAKKSFRKFTFGIILHIKENVSGIRNQVKTGENRRNKCIKCKTYKTDK